LRNEGKAPVVVDLFDKEFQLSDLAKGIKSHSGSLGPG
jgi:hypothetical protein